MRPSSRAGTSCSTPSGGGTRPGRCSSGGTARARSRSCGSSPWIRSRGAVTSWGSSSRPARSRTRSATSTRPPRSSPSSGSPDSSRRRSPETSPSARRPTRPSRASSSARDLASPRRRRPGVVDSEPSKVMPDGPHTLHAERPCRAFRQPALRADRSRAVGVAAGRLPRPMTPEEARERLQEGGPAERRETLHLLAQEADARVTPPVAALLHADDPELVALAETTLWQVWSRSGDPAVDALFAEGVRAMEAQDCLGAVAQFSRVVEAAPSFAEGWNKRATARYLATHYATSIADCEEVLRLNPYHFGALSGQGLCHAALGQLREAARCFRRALAVHPRLEAVRQNLSRTETTLARANGHALGALPGSADTAR